MRIAQQQQSIALESWLLQLADLAESQEKPEAYVPMAASKLRGLSRSLGLGNIDAFPISEVWEYLSDRGVSPLEIEPLRAAAPVPKVQQLKRLNSFAEVSKDFELLGKPIVWSLWLDDPNVERYAKPLLAWFKAILRLSKYPKAKKLFESEVKKIRIQDKGHGSEDASWQAGGVLALTLKDKPTVSMLLHELGHALEDQQNFVVMAHQDNPYGSPPFISSVAEINAAEDFAETFRAILEEPQRLKREAPQKYQDMQKILRRG